MGLKNDGAALPTRFCVSGSPQQFAELSQQWLGYVPRVEKIYTRQPSLEREPSLEIEVMTGVAESLQYGQVEY
jgi:glutamate racemase